MEQNEVEIYPVIDPIIQISDLKKKMGSEFLLDVPELIIPKGRIVSLIGLNGSGKSTLLSLIVGYFIPTSGSCKTLGIEAKELSDKEYAQLGYVPQRPDLIPFMIGSDLLRYIATFYDTWDHALEQEMVEHLGLKLNKKISAMSPGEVQKIAIIIALSFRPKLLILDEPAAELDPIARAELLEYLLKLLRESETTVIISSHVLTDVERIADTVVLLHEGKLLKHSSLDDFREDRTQINPTGESIVPSLEEAFRWEIKNAGRK
jgi:ABC-2 type transport system ATP-binding protein